MRVMRRGSATDNGRGDEPDAGIGMRHGAELEGSATSYAAWAGSNHVRFCLHIFDLVTLTKF
jgi:hypothetical protein